MNAAPETTPAQTPTVHQYLRHVGEELARHGHRDIRAFQVAFAMAAVGVEARTNEMARATLVRDALLAGLAHFVSGYVYFDRAVSVAYARLVDDYNTLVP